MRQEGRALTLVAGKLLDERSQMLAAYRFKLWLALAAGATLAFFFGWAVSQRGLRPLRALATRARAIDAQHLHLRLDGSHQVDELRALGDALNQMLLRLEDGFGRLSRFSKIGGEMVPHEPVEDLINKALGHADDERRIAIVGVPDEAKGEALILLSSNPDIDLHDLRTKLVAEGVPALWIPKKIIDVPEIPILASGKLDIKGCEDKAHGS